eukprot:gnl/MRDRNA2_/MRDRNA2_93223_c0_seq1.p1 gnl/MRDRNA2_/MRDRNA2_93223_c0~~gnl/MRDRNA2_/MRDRNA2_93223_c0_seq1.p1  ORF type:complete len:137 (-),score=21.49 gnl/MRDRNA2_/MRDRNA2_93223_c0_seq1:122-532(-)
MRSAITLILFAVSTQAVAQSSGGTSDAQGSIDNLVDKVALKLVNSLFDRVLKTLPMHPEDMDEAILRKPGTVAVPTHANLRTVITPPAQGFSSRSRSSRSPPAQPNPKQTPKRVDPVLPWADYQPELHAMNGPVHI